MWTKAFTLFIYTLILSAYPICTKAQTVHFNNSTPVFLPVDSSPIISINNSKHYFIRKFFTKYGSFGGVIEQDNLLFNDTLLLFYEHTPLTSLNSEQQNTIISIDDRRVYYYNRNPTQAKFKGIFYLDALSASSTLPQKLIIDQFDLSNVHSFFMNSTSDLLLFSIKHKGGQGNEDIYVSFFVNEKWSTPINLGETINTTGSEISPFLSEDQNTLYFSSTEHNSFGKGDIFMSKRLYNSWKVWSPPRNLGSEINSEGHEAYLNIADSSRAYFISERSGEGELWQVDILTSQLNSFRDLTIEREYLSNDEIVGLFGFAVDSTLSFVQNQSELSSESKELLWFIANNIISKSDIMLNVVFLANDTSNLLRGREVALKEYLNFIGISRNRIATHVIPLDNSVPDSVHAVINFYLKK